MLTHTRKMHSVQRGRLSVALISVLITGGVGAMALTFTPTKLPTKENASSMVTSNEFDVRSYGFAVTGEVDLSGAAHKSGADGRPASSQEPLYLDHSVLNNPDIISAPNPAPMAIGAYD